MNETTDTTNEAAMQTLAQRAWFRLEGVIERLQDFVSKMNTQNPAESGTTVARETSIGTDSSVHGNSAPVAKIDQHDHGSKATAQLAIILAGMALGGLLVLAILTYVVWTEYRLADLHLRDMKAAMLAHGINPHPHMPGESP